MLFPAENLEYQHPCLVAERSGTPAIVKKILGAHPARSFIEAGSVSHFFCVADQTRVTQTPKQVTLAFTNCP